MKAYSKYKDSGTIWIGEIPDGWDCIKLKYKAAVQTSNIDKKEHENAIKAKIIHYNDVVKNKYIYDGYGFDYGYCSESQFQAFRLSKGDIIITKDSMDVRNIADICLVQDELHDVVFGYHLSKISVYDSAFYPQYLFYYLSQSQVKKHFLLNSAGVTIIGLGKTTIENITIVLPSLPEQEAIADFLDRKTAQIDTLIEKEQRQIDLLQEQRTALINHAVTRGLRPDVRMKDSGVEWLGEIPSHWEVKSLRRYDVLVQTGPFGSQLHASDYVPNGFPVVNPANMINGIIVPDDGKQISDEKRQELSQHTLKKGDIVFARRGELGRAVLVTEKEEGWLCGTGSILIRFFETRLRSDYLSYYLQLPSLRDYFISESVGTTMDNLNSQILLAMPLLELPTDEQVEIVDYVNSIQEKTQLAIEKVSNQIELLQEYRTALISEAVTGKVDVRTETVHE